ncbi:glycosyltransferase [uncultured Parabacteroides sp.]|uniref:glycosyltransferase family 2 protein n=1 Tax=uncultured Parabacteroides sp. TaxID=512312 RepID=UPI00262C5FC1|nr:glycosyltransferase [uncultured Parabacteroides sp.]
MQSFSVLLSLYHKESALFLRQSLESIFTQTLSSAEVILVEDGPLTDELYAVVRDFEDLHPELKVILLPTNQGLGKALNEGLKYCSYDIVARMDTDDIAKPDRFEKQLSIFREYPEVDVVGAWIDEFEGEVSNVLSVRKVPEWHGKIFLFAKRRNPVNHPVVMFRRSAVLKAGGYKHFPLFEDYYLWVRMLMDGARFYNIQESLLFFRSSPDMFKRRGGWRYALTEVRLQMLFYRMNFINLFSLLRNICIRLITRLLPNDFRSLLYKRFIRS